MGSPTAVNRLKEVFPYLRTGVLGGAPAGGVDAAVIGVARGAQRGRLGNRWSVAEHYGQVKRMLFAGRRRGRVRGRRGVGGCSGGSWTGPAGGCGGRLVRVCVPLPLKLLRSQPHQRQQAAPTRKTARAMNNLRLPIEAPPATVHIWGRFTPGRAGWPPVAGTKTPYSRGRSR
jgi:hypothetical protein